MPYLALLLAAGCSGQIGTTSSLRPNGTSGAGGSPATTGGSPATTGSGGGGPGGSSAGGGGSFEPPPRCDAGPGAARPSLMPGVWTAINPQGQVFGGDPANGSMLQGVAIDPCIPSTLYACLCNFDTTKGGLYRSIDGGANWTKIGPFDQPLHVRIDPRNPLHMYVGDAVRGNTQGFWVSHDGGASWAKTAGWMQLSTTMFIDDVYDVAVDPADFNHVLATSHSPWNGFGKPDSASGVLESKDAGETWVAHQPASATWNYGHGISFLKNSTSWLLGTQSNGYWRTTDSGTTWNQVSTENMAHGGGQIYISKTGVIYSGGYDQMQRSTDDGATWTKVGTLAFTTSVFGDGTTLYTHHAYGGTTPEPFYTSPETDGVNWTPSSNGGMFTNGPFEMALDSINGVLYSGNWGNGLLAFRLK